MAVGRKASGRTPRVAPLLLLALGGWVVSDNRILENQPFRWRRGGGSEVSTEEVRKRLRQSKHNGSICWCLQPSESFNDVHLFYTRILARFASYGASTTVILLDTYATQRKSMSIGRVKAMVDMTEARLKSRLPADRTEVLPESVLPIFVELDERKLIPHLYHGMSQTIDSALTPPAWAADSSEIHAYKVALLCEAYYYAMLRPAVVITGEHDAVNLQNLLPDETIIGACTTRLVGTDGAPIDVRSIKGLLWEDMDGSEDAPRELRRKLMGATRDYLLQLAEQLLHEPGVDEIRINGERLDRPSMITGAIETRLLAESLCSAILENAGRIREPPFRQAGRKSE